MRTRLLATVAAIAIATPAFAADLSGGYVPPSGDPIYSSAPTVVGHLQIGFGYADWEEEGDEKSFGLFEGAGRANIPFANWNLLAEVTGGAISEEGESFQDIGAYGHLWSNWGGARVGVFGGVGYFGLVAGTVGVEGEVEFGALDLGAQASYNWGDTNNSDTDAWGVRGWAEWYFTQNTKLRGELAWWNVDSSDCCGGEFDIDVLSASLGVEHRFASMPFSGYARLGYQNAEFDSNCCGSGDADAWSIMVGTRIFMDGAGTTLRDHDRQVPFDFRLPFGSAGLADML